MVHTMRGLTTAIVVQLSAHAAAAELTLVAINAGGRSCMYEDTVMEQDRYYLGGVSHATTDHPALHQAGSAEHGAAVHSVFNTSRVGPVVMYSIPVPGNAGDRGRGWQFALSLLFDKHLALEAPFDGPVTCDIKIQGVIVRPAVRLSGGRGARSVVTVPLTIDPVQMVLFLPEANAVVPFGGFVHVEIAPVLGADQGSQIAHVSALRLVQPTSKNPAAAEVIEDEGDDDDDVESTPGLTDTVLGWAMGSIPGQAALLYCILLGLQRGGSSLRRQGSSAFMASKDQELTDEASMEPVGEKRTAETEALDCDAAANRAPACSPGRDAADEVASSPHVQRRKRRPRKVLSADEVTRQRQLEEAAVASELAARLAAVKRSASAQASVDAEEKETAEALSRTSATVAVQLHSKPSSKAIANTSTKAGAAGTGAPQTSGKIARVAAAGRPAAKQAGNFDSDLVASKTDPQVAAAKPKETDGRTMVLRSVPLEALFGQPAVTTAQTEPGHSRPPSSASIVEESLSEPDSASSDLSATDTTWMTNSVNSGIDEPPSSPARPTRLQLQLEPATARLATKKGAAGGHSAGTWAQRVTPRADAGSETDSLNSEGGSGDDDDAEGNEEGQAAWTPRADAAAWSPGKKKRKRKRNRKHKAQGLPVGLLPLPPMCHFGQACLDPNCQFLHAAPDQLMMMPPNCSDLFVVPPPPSSSLDEEDARARMAAQGLFIPDMISYAQQSFYPEATQ